MGKLKNVCNLKSEVYFLPWIKIGVANGKIRDSPRRRDRCLKIGDRDLKRLPKIRVRDFNCPSVQRNRAQDFNYTKLRARDVRFVCSWLLVTGSHFPVLPPFTSTPCLISATLTLLSQRDNFCRRTSAKKANPRLRDFAKKIRDSETERNT